MKRASANAVILYITSGGTTTLVRGANGWEAGEPPQKAQWHVVTNLIDETFMPLDMPALRGADRRSFIGLQLETMFSDSPLRAALPFKAKSKAGQHKAVLTGVSNLDAETAVRKLVEQDAHVVGVWSLPTLMMDALVTLGGKAPATLLMTVPTPEGLRLLFVNDRQPALTRLLPGNATPAQQTLELLATKRYLQDSKALERDATLPLLALDTLPKAAAELTAQGLSALPTPWPKDTQPGLQHMLNLVLKRPPGQLAPAKWRIRHQAHRLQTWLLRATGAGLALAFLGGAQLAQAGADIWYQIGFGRLELEQKTRELEAVKHSLSLVGVDAELLLQAQQVSKTELVDSAHLPQLLTELGAELQRHPNLALQRLEWKRQSADKACQITPDGGGTPGAAAAGGGAGGLPGAGAMPGMNAGAAGGPLAAGGPGAAGGMGGVPGVPAMPGQTAALGDAAPAAAKGPVMQVQFTLKAPVSDSPLDAARLRQAFNTSLKQLSGLKVITGAEEEKREVALSSSKKGGAQSSAGSGAGAGAGAGPAQPGMAGGGSGEGGTPWNYCLISAAKTTP